jgi:hypothetical protein
VGVADAFATSVGDELGLATGFPPKKLETATSTMTISVATPISASQSRRAVEGLGRCISERRMTPLCCWPEGGESEGVVPSPSAMGSAGYIRHDKQEETRG